MTVRMNPDGVVELHGECASEDAEGLLNHLMALPTPMVDWRSCNSAHAAVVQVLMVSGATLLGPPRGAFLTQFVEPALKAR